MTVSVSPADPPPPNGVDAWLAGRRPLLVWTVVFFGLFVLLYGQELFGFTLSIDEEMAFYRHDYAAWVEQGRWGIYLIETLFTPEAAIPAFPLAIYGALLALTVALASDRLRIASPSLRVLGFALVATFATTLAMAEFAPNAIPMGVAVLSAFLCARAAEKPGLAWAAAYVGLLAFALSLYQSVLFLVAAFAIGQAMADTPPFAPPGGDDESLGTALRRWGKLVLLTVAGLVLYVVINRLFLWALHVQTNYVTSFFSPRFPLQHPVTAAHAVLVDIKHVDFGLWSTAERGFRPSPPLALLMVAAPVCIAWGLWRRFRQAPLAALLCGVLLAAMVLLPFTLSAFSPIAMPYRSVVAAPFVVWILVVLAERAVPLRWVRTAIVLVMALAVLQQWQQLSSFFYAARLVGWHDRIIAGRLSAAIDRVTPVQARLGGQPIPLVVSGPLAFENGQSFKGSTTTAGSSFFEWDGGNEKRIAPFMNMLGLGPFAAPSPQQKAQMTPRAAALPVWPDEGSVQFQDGVVLIHLGVPEG